MTRVHVEAARNISSAADVSKTAVSGCINGKKKGKEVAEDGRIRSI